MIDREQLRQAMELNGYDQESIDKFMPLMIDIAERVAGIIIDIWESTVSFLRSINMADLLEDLASAVAVCLRSTRKPLPRPPRYAGPQNKGRMWTLAPSRVARSHCKR